jgi:hypothetical protein
MSIAPGVPVVAESVADVVERFSGSGLFVRHSSLRGVVGSRVLVYTMVLAGPMNTGSNESVCVWLADYSLQRTIRCAAHR